MDPGSFTSGVLVARYDADAAGRARRVRARQGAADPDRRDAADVRRTGVRRRQVRRPRTGCCGCSRPVSAPSTDPVTLNAELEIAGNWSVP